MNKKISIALCAIILMIGLLSGCKLAKEDKKPQDNSKDMLCGYYITKQLDIPNEESVFYNTYDDLIEKGINNENNYSEENRIYATEKQVIEGTSQRTEYNFEGIDGVSFFHTTIPASNGNEEYGMINNGNYIDNISESNNTTDEGKEVGLSGDMYVSKDFNDIVYLNQVFQTPEGKVYMIPASMGVMLFPPASSLKISSENTTTTNDNGESISKTFKVELTIMLADDIQKVVFKQMDKNNNKVDEKEILPESIPEKISLKSDAAYILVEEYVLNIDGEMQIKRSIINANDSLARAEYTYRVSGENGFAVGKQINFEKSS